MGGGGGIRHSHLVPSMVDNHNFQVNFDKGKKVMKKKVKRNYNTKTIQRRET